MLAWTAETAGTLVAAYGLPVLFVLFVLEGALIGKLVPTRAILVATVLLGSSALDYVTVGAVAAAGATVGQCLVFLAVRSNGPGIVERADRYVDERLIERSRGWVDRWGLSAVLVGNALPVVRGYPTIPVALSDTPAYTFPLFSLAGSVLYLSVLVAAAAGLDSLLGI
jgi:membrane protein DedA with SNARE-associated domain